MTVGSLIKGSQLPASVEEVIVLAGSGVGAMGRLGTQVHGTQVVL